MSRCLNARPGAPRDSAPAAVYVVFGPALKKLWKQKFKLVMALPTSRYGSKVLGNLGRLFRNNTTKFGGIQNETCAEAKTSAHACITEISLLSSQLGHF